MRRGLSDAVEKFAGGNGGSHSFCHYVIVDNRIHRRCYGEHVGFKMFPDSTFSLLAKMVRASTAGNNPHSMQNVMFCR